MKTRRRLTFQLTPLLDLLLIVIFAQYMEVQQTAESAESDLQVRRENLEAELHQRQQELENRILADNANLAAQRSQYSRQFESILRQHIQAATTLARAFNLPGRIVEQALRLRTSGAADDANRIEQAGLRIQELLDSREPELLRFLVRFDEMQKHVSIWELHLQGNGQAQLTDGQQRRLVAFETPEEFATRCLEATKSFAEPHPLVLILMTYGDAQAGFRRSATKGLPLFVERLKSEAAGTRWFDYSLMGFRPNGPLLNASPGVSAEQSPSGDSPQP